MPDKAALAAEIAADGRLRPSDKVVAFTLLFRFHNTRSGQCNPSYEKLAAACCLERRTVINAIHRLETAGYLKVQRTAGDRNQRNRFRFNLVKPETVTFGTPFQSQTVNAETAKGERLFTPYGELEFTRIELGEEERGNLSTVTETFARFWEAYPKRVDRKEAMRVYERIIRKGEATSAQLVAGAQRYAEECKAARKERQYIKSPVTWLNRGCWDDELAPLSVPNGNRGTNNLSGFSEAVVRRACGRDLEGRQ